MAWHGMAWRLLVMAGVVGVFNLRALGAVGDARGAEVGDLEDGLGASHGGSGDSDDGGGELHLDGWGFWEFGGKSWWWCC